MIKAGVINKYSQECKKKEKKKKKKKKKKNGFVVISTSAGFSYTIYKELIPVLYKREDGGKQERQNETTFMDLIMSNRPAPRAVLLFSMFQDLVWLLKF